MKFLRVYAMARPCRPVGEGQLVREAEGGNGTVSERAARLAHAVASASMEDMDRDEAERIIGLLRALAPTAVHRLATGPEFGTTALIVRERIRRMEARGGRHLAPSEWKDDDRAVLKAVSATLARRYRSYLSAPTAKKLP